MSVLNGTPYIFQRQVFRDFSQHSGPREQNDCNSSRTRENAQSVGLSVASILCDILF